MVLVKYDISKNFYTQIVKIISSGICKGIGSDLNDVKKSCISSSNTILNINILKVYNIDISILNF